MNLPRNMHDRNVWNKAARAGIPHTELPPINGMRRTLSFVAEMSRPEGVILSASILYQRGAKFQRRIVETVLVPFDAADVINAKLRAFADAFIAART